MNPLRELIENLYPAWKITEVRDARGRVSYSVSRLTPCTPEQRAAGMIDSFVEDDLRRVADRLGRQQAIRDQQRL